MKTLIDRVPGGLLAFMLMLLFSMIALITSAQPGPLKVRGIITVPEEIISPTSMELIHPDGRRTPVKLGPGGRFRSQLPQHGLYHLLFHKPGCRSKVVVVDQRAVVKGAGGKLRFEVVLEPGNGVAVGEDMMLAGRITITPISGVHQVEYTHQLYGSPGSDVHSAGDGGGR